MTLPRRRPNPEERADDQQRQRIAAALHHDLDNITAAWPTIQHAAYTMGRGYPSQPPDGAPARLLTPDELEHGVVHLTLVERLADDRRPDLSVQALEWFAHLKETMGHIRLLANEAAKLTAQATTDDEGEPVCIVHARHGAWEPIDHNQRCRWCYNFRLAEGVDPPWELLKARAEGRRITDRMVRAALGKTRGSRR